MLYSVYCLDDPATPNARTEFYPLHRAFLDNPPMHVVVAGPLLAPDGETRIGSLLVIEADTVEDAVRHVKSDPFAINNVWESIDVRGFVKLVDNR